jgi:hypothetical protein
MNLKFFILGALTTALIYGFSYYIPYFIRLGWLDAQRKANKRR